jgi:DNA-binding NarL/FixJ family response regulator
MWTQGPSGGPAASHAAQGALDTNLANLWESARELDEEARFAQYEPPSYTRSADRPPDSARRLVGAAPASIFWQSLTSGNFVVIETLTDETRCIALARERLSAESNALSDRELVLLHRAFQAELQKNLAFGFDLSMSTVSQVLSSALTKLGVGGRMRSAPLPVVLAALKHCGVIELPAVRFASFHRGGQSHIAIGLPALDTELLTELSLAERRVARLLASGATSAEIAAQRGTSPCTVSNQMATLCRKLHVRGRFELILRWAELQWGMSAAAQ